jgi:hypothetical protein
VVLDAKRMNKIAQLEVNLLEIATSSYRFDYALTSSGSYFGRLSFDLRLNQLFKIIVVPHEIICYMNKVPNSPYYFFNLVILVD